MKKITLFLLTIGLFSQVKAQNYYYNASKGADPEYSLNDVLTKGKKIIGYYYNDSLSKIQNIPFSFYFYGNAVTQYKVSDNGYITFNTAATVSDKTATDLPSGTEPNSAIYAFWKDWELKPAGNAEVGVFSYTIGTAPNRKHIIQWQAVSPRNQNASDNNDIATFAILLHEGSSGRFDIMVNGVVGDNQFTGTMGCENSDASAGIHVESGKSFNYPFVKENNAVLFNVYKFHFGNQPNFDLAVIASDFPKMLQKNKDYNVSGTVANYGKTAITSLNFNYSIDGGTTQTNYFSGLDIRPNGGTFDFVHSLKIKEINAGFFKVLKIWVNNLNNGNADEKTSNDALIIDYVATIGTSAPRKVLFEVATGAWSEHCPDADSYIKKIKTKFKDTVVFVAHHNNDSMTNAQSDLLNSTFTTNFPSAFINRNVLPESINTPNNKTVGVFRDVWISHIDSIKKLYTPATVAVKNITFNPTTREIKAEVEATFSDYYSGDIRLGCMIKESYIRGSSGLFNVNEPHYDQRIAAAYTNDGNHMYGGKPALMHGYYHNNVVIDIPSGAWGKNGTIPNKINAGEKITASFTYILPNMVKASILSSSQFEPVGNLWGRNKPMDIWVVGFLAQYSVDVNARRILNSSETKMWNTLANVPVKQISGPISVYPNVANNAIQLSFDAKSANEKTSVTIFTLSGQVVIEKTIAAKMGKNTVEIDTQTLSNGIYLVKVSSNSFTGSARIVVQH